MADQVKFSLPLDYLKQYIPSIQGVDAASVTAAAKKFIHPEALLYVIVGDVAKIEPGLRELNIGEIGHLDAEGNPIAR